MEQAVEVVLLKVVVSAAGELRSGGHGRGLLMMMVAAFVGAGAQESETVPTFVQEVNRDAIRGRVCPRAVGEGGQRRGEIELHFRHLGYRNLTQGKKKERAKKKRVN